MRNYEGLPNYPTNDIDILLSQDGLRKIEKFQKKFAEKTLWRPYAKKYHANLTVEWFWYYKDKNNRLFTLDLEFRSEYVINSKWFFQNIEICPLPTDLILCNRQRYKFIWVPVDSIEAIHLLLEYCFAGKERFLERILEKYQNNKKDISELLFKLYGKKIKEYIINALESKNKYNIKKIDNKLFDYLKRYYKPSLYKILKHDINGILKRISNLLNPSGILVVFLGPDGVGKTTIADIISYYFKKRRFPFVFRRNLGNRPLILPSLKRDFLSIFYQNINQREKKDEISKNKDKNTFENPYYKTIRMLWHLLDYILDYYIILRFHLVKGSLIISERYAYDYWAAQERFLPGVSERIRKLMYKLAPTPNIVLYLDAEPEGIFNRKQEVSLKVIKKQIKRYRFLANERKEIYEIDNNILSKGKLMKIVGIILKYSENNFNIY